MGFGEVTEGRFSVFEFEHHGSIIALGGDSGGGDDGFGGHWP